jgi:hypothetical protein
VIGMESTRKPFLKAVAGDAVAAPMLDLAETEIGRLPASSLAIVAQLLAAAEHGDRAEQKRLAALHGDDDARAAIAGQSAGAMAALLGIARELAGLTTPGDTSATMTVTGVLRVDGDPAGIAIEAVEQSAAVWMEARTLTDAKGGFALTITAPRATPDDAAEHRYLVQALDVRGTPIARSEPFAFKPGASHTIRLDATRGPKRER